ncbi:MAG: DUF3370 domain-containing protein [Cyanobacteria bacterium J06632_22]
MNLLPFLVLTPLLGVPALIADVAEPGAVAQRSGAVVRAQVKPGCESRSGALCLRESHPQRLKQRARSGNQRVVRQPQAVRPLPGQLDQVPVFNSNSPELIQSEGILLSTFPPNGKAQPEAHLNYAFEGRFDIFDHHVVRAQGDRDTRTLFVGIILHNPGRRAVSVRVREAASYISQDSPWHERESAESNLASTSFSGPGSRLMNDILRDRTQAHWPRDISIPAGESYLLMNAPIPIRRLSVATDGTLPPGSEILPPRPASLGGNRSNARSTLMRLDSSGPVYAASLAMYAPESGGRERVPSLADWQRLLFRGRLAEMRDRIPTPPRQAAWADPFIYGRVSGVAQGSRWVATLTDNDRAEQLTIPTPGGQISYPLSTVDRNTFGTGQVQSAPMLARYADTAYRAHGNYGIEYSLTMPLHNPTNQSQTVTLSVQTPIQNENLSNALEFLDPPDDRFFFRGTVLFLFRDETERLRASFIHLTQRRGQQGEPLVTLTLAPGEQRDVEMQFLYPPDATPPQVLTIATQSE